MGRTQWLHGYYFSPQTLRIQTTVSHTPKPCATSILLCPRVHHRKASTGLSEVIPDIDRTCGWKADLLGCRKSAGTPDARISRMSMRCRSRPQKHIQGTAITTDIRSRPQQLQRNSPARHLHHISLPTTRRRRCFHPSG